MLLQMISLGICFKLYFIYCTQSTINGGYFSPGQTPSPTMQIHITINAIEFYIMQTFCTTFTRVLVWDLLFPPKSTCFRCNSLGFFFSSWLEDSSLYPVLTVNFNVNLVLMRKILDNQPKLWQIQWNFNICT